VYHFAGCVFNQFILYKLLIPGEKFKLKSFADKAIFKKQKLLNFNILNR